VGWCYTSIGIIAGQNVRSAVAPSAADACFSTSAAAFTDAGGGIFTYTINQCTTPVAAGYYSFSITSTFGTIVAVDSALYTVSVVITAPVPVVPNLLNLVGTPGVNTTWSYGATTAAAAQTVFAYWSYVPMAATGQTAGAWAMLSVNFNATVGLAASSKLDWVIRAPRGLFTDACAVAAVAPCVAGTNCQFFIYPCSYPTSNIMFKITTGAVNNAWSVSVTRFAPVATVLTFPTTIPISMVRVCVCVGVRGLSCPQP
jgi:hypothetical protein